MSFKGEKDLNLGSSGIKLTGFIDHLIDSLVNEGVVDADSKASILAIWIDGENNKQNK